MTHGIKSDLGCCRYYENYHPRQVLIAIFIKIIIQIREKESLGRKMSRKTGLGGPLILAPAIQR